MPRRVVLPYDELCSGYLAGQSTNLLARSYGCSPTTIAKNLRACGITPRPSRFVAIRIDEAALRRMYLDERLPIAALAVVLRRLGQHHRQQAPTLWYPSPPALCDLNAIRFVSSLKPPAS